MTSPIVAVISYRNISFAWKSINLLKIQNSVFEGEITEVKLKELLLKAKWLMKKEEDSIIVFKSREEKWLEKNI